MNDHLATIIDSANEGMYVTDRERRFLLWNRAAERISGYTKDELIGRSCHDNILCHTDGEGHALCESRCPLQASIDDREPRGPEIIHLRHKSGKRIAVEVKTAPIRDGEGSVIGGVEIFQDVTGRLERERLLREGKEKLETVLDSIEDGILFLDTEGRVSVTNRACAGIFGLEKNGPTDALHARPDALELGNALVAVENAFRRSLTTAKYAVGERCHRAGGLFRCWTAGIDRTPFAPRSACYECSTYRAARTFLEKPRELARGERTFSVVSSFIELRETNELWEVIVFHDVTAEKLDAALKVAGAAAHELRQPLQVLVILGGLLEKGVPGNSPLESYARTLMVNCNRMDGIIRRMGEITRYATKEYVGGDTILDIERSSQPKSV